MRSIPLLWVFGRQMRAGLMPAPRVTEHGLALAKPQGAEAPIMMLDAMAL